MYTQTPESFPYLSFSSLLSTSSLLILYFIPLDYLSVSLTLLNASGFFLYFSFYKGAKFF